MVAAGVFTEPAVQKPVPPARCLLRHDLQFGRNLLILHATRGKQEDPGTLRAEALLARARHSSRSRCSVFSTTGRATRIVFAPLIVKTARK